MFSSLAVATVVRRPIGKLSTGGVEDDSEVNGAVGVGVEVDVDVVEVDVSLGRERSKIILSDFGDKLAALDRN